MWTSFIRPQTKTATPVAGKTKNRQAAEAVSSNLKSISVRGMILNLKNMRGNGFKLGKV